MLKFEKKKKRDAEKIDPKKTGSEIYREAKSTNAKSSLAATSMAFNTKSEHKHE